MPRSRRQVQQRVVRQVPTGDDMVNSLLNEDIPRIHAEVVDDWQPAFDTAGFGSQIAPPAQPSPVAQAPAPSAPVAAEDAAVAEDPSARLTDWDRANWDIGFPLGSTVPRVNETQVSQASVADALSQVAGGDLDSRMSASYEGTSGLDEYLSEQAQQGEQLAGQFDSDKGKQEDLGLVGGAKDESKPQTEYEMAQQSAWEAAPAAISSGVIGALGELFGSADYRAQNRGWGQRAAALIDDRVTRDRSFRNREQAASDRRAGIRGNIEERLGASKEAAQLADPGSEQSQRLQNMYSVRLAMAAPGVEASSLRDYLSNLAYSDEASRQALDGVLESAEKLRSEGRALQQEELIALMNAAVSLRRTDRTAMAREQSSRNSGGGGGGGGGAPITADWMLRREEELMALQGRNAYSPEERAARLTEIQNLQSAARRDPAARSLWDKYAQTTEGEIRRLEAQGGTVDATSIRENAEGARNARARISDAQAANVAMAIVGAARGGAEGWLQEKLGRLLADTEDQVVIEYANHVASLRDTLAHREFGASQTTDEARRLAQRLGGLGFVPSAAALDTWVNEAERFLLSQRQRQTQERFRGTGVDQPQGTAVRRFTKTVTGADGRPTVVERQSSDPENIRRLQSLGYTEVTQ